MQHMAKNVVMVNEGKTKFLVSSQTQPDVLVPSGEQNEPYGLCSSAGGEEQVREQQTAEDQPHPSAEVGRRQEHGGCSAQWILR